MAIQHSEFPSTAQPHHTRQMYSHRPSQQVAHMPNEHERTSGDKPLFRLLFHVGIGREHSTVEVMPGVGLQTFIAPSYMDNPQVIAFKERVELSVQLIAEPNVEIELFWDPTVADEEDVKPVRLYAAQPRVDLYRFQDKVDYPWPCGQYRLEVRCNGISYYGMYKITPKNVSESELLDMHALIEKHVSGLTFNWFVQSQSTSHGTVAVQGTNRAADWRLFTWFKRVEPLLNRALRWMEEHGANRLTPVYAVESVARRATTRSVQWEASARGVQYAGTKHYNRRMQPETDRSTHQAVKWWTMQLLQQLQLAQQSLKQTEATVQQQWAKLMNEWEEGKEKERKMTDQRYVADEELEQVRKLLTMKQRDREAVMQRRSELEAISLICQRELESLQRRMQSRFWRPIEAVMPRVVPDGYMWAPRLVRTLWEHARTGADTAAAQAVTLVPAYRSTPQVYEYYVFFTVVEVLQECGFQVEPVYNDNQLHGTASLTDNIANGTSAKHHSANGWNGLPTGYALTFTKNDMRIVAHYDALVEGDPETARIKGTSFYSVEWNRRPDIRLDLYEASSNTYCTSIIIEAKYRRLRTMYSDAGNTKVALQMSKYWAICYAAANGTYRRRCIYQVICAYPGGERSAAEQRGEAGTSNSSTSPTFHGSDPVVQEKPPGIFLQLYPARQHNQEITVGKHELGRLLLDWLQNGTR
ncbi:hypothetical protein [Paenibacillus sp. 481]|uniref:hypothetical protein n=1 Tax=Paenibacillus sp. 481 TaxID=2835869 RepID=UPI001E4D357B|nr:hypothetical protein [Paenibacillus sp. 481]UHA72386.1 hypothetical protein KIK04_17115 [Paenibacillus sp. 481]